MAHLRRMLSCLLILIAGAHLSFRSEGLVSGGIGRRDALLPGMRMPDHPHYVPNCAGSVASMVGCDASACGEGFHGRMKVRDESFRMAMKHREMHHLQERPASRVEFVGEAVVRDMSRTSHQRRLSSLTSRTLNLPSSSAHEFEARVQSGLGFGSGEYFMDVYIGTPRRHFSLIIDTGSDLNWVQCNPCRHCYDQEGLKFDRSASTSYNPIPCSDLRCHLLSSSDNPTCGVGSHCTYFYSYGDTSNTTGDLATETFTLNLSDGGLFHAEDIIFGCGHANEGLFRGAGGLMGLGRGPLSFATQLLDRYGRKFSYCLVSRDSDAGVSSSLIFGEDKALSHVGMQYTSFANTSQSTTFYYVSIEKVSVGGEFVSLPPSVWAMDSNGSGGTIVDSGTTLTYLTKPAYDALTAAFQAHTPSPSFQSPPLHVCYNVTPPTHLHFPSMQIHFADGAAWKLPLENYLIQLDTGDSRIACLAIMESSSLGFSILGNFLQQNMHMLYDLQNSRLGFAPMDCSSL